MKSAIRWIAGFGIAVVIIAPKAAVPILIVMFMVSLFHFRTIVIPTNLRNPSIVLLVLLIALIGISSAYPSNNHDPSWFMICVLILGGVFVALNENLAKTLRMPSVRCFVVNGALLGFGGIVVAAAYGLIVGDSLWGSYFSDPLTTLNNNAIVIVLTLPAFLLIVSRVSARLLYALPLGVLILLGFLSSTAALVALILGLIVCALRHFGGQKAGISIAILAAVMFLTAPNIIEVVVPDDATSPQVVNNSSSSVPYSVRHRLAMWAFAVEKIDEKPWLGWGFKASRTIPQEDRRLAPNMEIMPLHPHNMALQTRLEMGVPGAAILSALVFAVFYRLATFTDNGWKSGLAMATASGWLFVANVSYGMWQNWWIALAFLLAFLVQIAVKETTGEPNDTLR